VDRGSDVSAIPAFAIDITTANWSLFGRPLDLIIKVGAAVLIAVGMVVGVLVLWAGIIFVRIWSLFVMLSYL
jgi:hypothetical protein